MKEEDDLLTADFTDILDNNEEIDIDYVDAEVIKDDGYKFEILGYWHSKPILRQYKQYICVLGSKKQLLLINTDFPDLEKHKLDFLADYFKINKGSSHRAFDDAETCRQLFLKCNEVRK